MTDIVLNSLYSLLDGSFIPQTIIISIENTSTISIKGNGKSIGNINTDIFVLTLPPLKMSIKVFLQSTTTSTTIVENCIKSYKKELLTYVNEIEEIHLLFDVNETYDIIQEAILNFKNTNPCNAFIVTFHTNVNCDKIATASITEIDKHCKSVAESIANVVTYSFNTEFRKRCYALLGKETTDGLTIRELINRKLSDIKK
ncbi:uncharacterized protein LOC143912613 [Arctopsyche grandis]|uniref:uncharacterized protein LOC143912613 n=1 Tax=Arctopsyche grandis TaxID=121162 RepID=UPI00406DA45A